MFVRVVAPETKFAVGPLAQAGGWGPWHARGTGSGKRYIFVDEGYEQRFFLRRHQLFAVLQRALVLFCFVLFALQLSVCLWWHDYRRDDFPTLKFGVVIADLARHLLREEPFALSAAPAIRAGEPGRC